MLDNLFTPPIPLGIYQAVSENDLGRATTSAPVDVKLALRAPEITSPPRDASVGRGDAHVVRATATGVPAPNLYVTSPAGNVLAGGLIETVDEQTVVFSLPLDNVQVNLKYP